jgi:cell division protein FtsZ
LFKRLASNVGLGLRPNPPLNPEKPTYPSPDDAAARSAIEAGAPRVSHGSSPAGGAAGSFDAHGRPAPQPAPREHIEIPAFLRKHG